MDKCEPDLRIESSVQTCTLLKKTYSNFHATSKLSTILLGDDSMQLLDV